jgi:hypothetical protein
MLFGPVVERATCSGRKGLVLIFDRSKAAAEAKFVFL